MRTITVKGTGKVKAPVDYVVISMSLDSTDRVYETAMKMAVEQLEQLNRSVEAVGFEKKSIKTRSFDVNTEYVSVKDEHNNYKSEFIGYKVSHKLKLEFDFDKEILAKVLSAISACPANPQMHIHFTVKDPAVVSEELLRRATENARKKAEVLSGATGVKLGKLVSVDYNWGEVNVLSRTDFRMKENNLKIPEFLKSVDIEPEDVEASDTVTFVWGIEYE